VTPGGGQFYSLVNSDGYQLLAGPGKARWQRWLVGIPGHEPLQTGYG